MNVYLVGGAVRDQLLGRPVHERDWVVVGATAADMLRLGFRQVGKDFPVFLHPKTGEEYALARTERKTGPGYTGFAFHASKEVTLEEDLKRRDLTINAIAQSLSGELIDPYHGQRDIEQKQLRHVSRAFVEDPVRILRVARFAARYAHLGFHIASETLQLMKHMVASGEVAELTSERVWKELERALAEKNPEIFFSVLTECGALSVLFPYANLVESGIPALVRAVTLSEDTQVRFAALFYAVSLSDLKAFSLHFRAPNEYVSLAECVVGQAAHYDHITHFQAEEVFQFLQASDAFRREERFKKMLLAYQASGFSSKAEWIINALHAAKKIEAKHYLDQFKGKALGDKLKTERISAIAHYLRSI